MDTQGSILKNVFNNTISQAYAIYWDAWLKTTALIPGVE